MYYVLMLNKCGILNVRAENCVGHSLGLGCVSPCVDSALLRGSDGRQKKMSVVH